MAPPAAAAAAGAGVLCGRLGHVAPWRALLRRYPQTDVGHAFEPLEAVGLDEGFANRRADQLCGGQRQRVGIAPALMQRPGLVLADEPTSSLDPKTSVEVMALLAELSARRGITIIVNIHNVDLARRYAQHIIGLCGGALIETFHIATLGTGLALAMAIPLSFLAARNFTRSATMHWIAQFIFVSSRSVNPLIWALLFVAIFGPGALAGVLSIAFAPSASSASRSAKRWKKPTAAPSKR